MTLRALTLDFKKTPRQWSVLGLVVLVIAALALSYVVNMERNLAGRIELTEARLSQLTKHGKIKPAQPVDAEQLQLDIRQANEILRQLALPWETLFKAVEANREQEVALLSIQPNVEKRTVRIAGEAKNFEALLAYMTLLEQSKTLRHVYLTSHEVRSQDAEKPVRFTLVADWEAQP